MASQNQKATCPLGDCRHEICELVMHRRKWGDEIRRFQEVIDPPSDVNFDSNVEKVIWQQEQMTDTRTVWEALGGRHHPHIVDLVIRLSVLAVQSANVERVCKAHGVIHTKARNCLTNLSVIMLLFCYVNLRLLRKKKSEENKTTEDFLLSALNDELNGDKSECSLCSEDNESESEELEDPNGDSDSD